MHLSAIHPTLPFPDDVAVSASGLTRQLVPRGDGGMPLAHRLARDGALGGLRALGPDALRVIDANGGTALDWASGSGRVECVQFLLPFFDLDAGAKRTKKMRHGRTPAHWAARNSRVEVLRVLLRHAPHLLTQPTADGTLPVHMACYSGNALVVGFLWEHWDGSASADDWRRAKNNWGCTVLHFACLKANEDALAFLREALGEEFERMFAEDENSDGVTPEKKLQWARDQQGE